MVVDLPAPLGPRKPKKSPRATAKEMPSTPTTPPRYDFRKFDILSASDMRALFPQAVANRVEAPDDESQRARQCQCHSKTQSSWTFAESDHGVAQAAGEVEERIEKSEPAKP